MLFRKKPDDFGLSGGALKFLQHTREQKNKYERIKRRKNFEIFIIVAFVMIGLMTLTVGTLLVLNRYTDVLDMPFAGLLILLIIVLIWGPVLMLVSKHIKN